MSDKIFSLDLGQLGQIERDGQVWYSLPSLVDVLGLSMDDALASLVLLDEDELIEHSEVVLGAAATIPMVSESGLYFVIFQADTPQAKAFQKQVKQMLISLRQHGHVFTKGQADE